MRNSDSENSDCGQAICSNTILRKISYDVDGMRKRIPSTSKKTVSFSSMPNERTIVNGKTYIN